MLDPVKEEGEDTPSRLSKPAFPWMTLGNSAHGTLVTPNKKVRERAFPELVQKVARMIR